MDYLPFDLDSIHILRYYSKLVSMSFNPIIYQSADREVKEIKSASVSTLMILPLQSDRGKLKFRIVFEVCMF